MKNLRISWARLLLASLLVGGLGGCGDVVLSSDSAAGAPPCIVTATFDWPASERGAPTPAEAVRDVAATKRDALARDRGSASVEAQARRSDDEDELRGYEALERPAESANVDGEGRTRVEARNEQGEIVASAYIGQMPAGGFRVLTVDYRSTKEGCANGR